MYKRKPKVPTQQAKLLHKELEELGIYSMLEYDDGHKSVDIFIPSANLYIEIDGPQHYTRARVILADLQRDHYSDLDGIPTFRIPNMMIEKNVRGVAKAIVDYCVAIE